MHWANVDVIKTQMINVLTNDVEADEITCNVYDLRIFGIVGIQKAPPSALRIKPPNSLKTRFHCFHTEFSQLRWVHS